MTWTIAIIQAAAIAVSISVDALAAAFAYGCKKITIPLLSLVIVNLICTGVIGASFLFGTVLAQYISQIFAAGLAFAILFLIGITKLFDSITKSIIQKYTEINKEIKLSAFNFKLVMRIYASPEAADVDISKSISPREAAVLAVSLSLDGFAVGLSAAIIGVNGLTLVFFTLATGFAALFLGSWLGNKAADKLAFNISWLAGAILIGLAFMQLA
ncbi:MAG: manganese efflux pump [Firmicutes bacterium]|nr:manganese efflux pump [Bacillota bacterium]